MKSDASGLPVPNRVSPPAIGADEVLVVDVPAVSDEKTGPAEARNLIRWAKTGNEVEMDSQDAVVLIVGGEPPELIRAHVVGGDTAVTRTLNPALSHLMAQAANMGRSVAALGPAIAALNVETSPPLASAIQATENLWVSIERRWGLLKSTEVAELLGARTSNRSFASALRKKGKLIGVERANAYAYPGFQFDRRNGIVHDIIPPLIGAARDLGMDDEDLVLWLCSPSRYFADALPVEHLLGDPEIVDKLVNSESISW